MNRKFQIVRNGARKELATPKGDKNVLSEQKIKKIKSIKPQEFNEQFICDFYHDWEKVRRTVKKTMDRYEKLYRDNKDFREYVDRFMRNKDIPLKTVLSMKQVQIVADMYEGESK